ncbi:MAG: cytochrome P450 [Burkholderiales bacterium]|nr:cytochrome P450 [Burkholderiales bacterium]
MATPHAHHAHHADHADHADLAGPASPAALAPGFSLAAPPPGFFDDPHPFFDALRTHDPVHALAPNSVLLTRYDDLLALYRSKDASSDKQKEFGAKFGAGTPIHEHHTTSLVFNDPPLHTRVRRILMGALTQRAIARMEAGVTGLVDGLLDRLEASAEPDLIEDFAAQIPVEVIGNLLAIPHEERGPLRAWSLAILSALEPAPDAALLERANAAVGEFIAYLRTLLAGRARHPGDPEVDMLTRLMLGDAEGTLTGRELMHNCIFLLNAGHETTTNLIGNGVHALMRHRDQFDRLAAEPALITSAVEELLRYESPIQLNNRLTTAPVPVSDREIAAGTFVTLAIGAANRDPAAFAEPHRLDIARKPNNHLAFGQGAHACSGMNVARMEGRIAIGALVKRFPRIEPAGTPERDRRVRFRGFRRLPVRVR